MILIQNTSEDKVVVSDTLTWQPKTSQHLSESQIPLIADAITNGRLTIDGELPQPFKLVKNPSDKAKVISRVATFQPDASQWIAEDQMHLISDEIKKGRLAIAGDLSQSIRGLKLIEKREGNANGETNDGRNDGSKPPANEQPKPAPKRRRKPQPNADDGDGVSSETTE